MNDEQGQQGAAMMEPAVERSLSPITAIKAGARDARAAAESVRASISRGAYRLAYRVSYGVVYGALTVTAWVPACHAAIEGIRDGTSAAERAFKAPRESADAVGTIQPEAGMASA